MDIKKIDITLDTDTITDFVKVIEELNNYIDRLEKKLGDQIYNAAPDMYAVLSELLDDEYIDDMSSHMVKRIIDVLAKAKGKQ